MLNRKSVIQPRGKSFPINLTTRVGRGWAGPGSLSVVKSFLPPCCYASSSESIRKVIKMENGKDCAATLGLSVAVEPAAAAAGAAGPGRT